MANKERFFVDTNFEDDRKCRAPLLRHEQPEVSETFLQNQNVGEYITSVVYILNGALSCINFVQFTPV